MKYGKGGGMSESKGGGKTRPSKVKLMAGNVRRAKYMTGNVKKAKCMK